MLHFDAGTIHRLQNPNVGIDSKLHVIARYIEERYTLSVQPNHWDSVFESWDQTDRMFYKLWLWLVYAEHENLVAPVPEFEAVFGSQRRDELLAYLQDDDEAVQDLASFYREEGGAGKVLLNWGLQHLNSNYSNR